MKLANLEDRALIHFIKFSSPTLLLLSLLFATANTYSAGSVQIQYLHDSDDTSDTFIDLDTDLSKRVNLFAGIGNTHSPASSGGIDLDYWNIGLGIKLSTAFDIELELGNFGQDRDIDVDTIDAQLRWKTANWSFTLRPQYDEYTVLLRDAIRTRSFDSTGIGAGLEYHGSEQWAFSLAYDTYDYSISTRLLSVPFFIERISSKALIVASGLRDTVASADLTYMHTNTDITLSYIRSTSAIDASASDIYVAAFDFYQLLPYRFGIELGSIGSDADEASYFGGLTLGYLW